MPGRRLQFVFALFVVAAGLLLRLRQLEAFRLSPDDGNALYSARVHLLEQGGFHPLRWIGEDARWIGEMREGFGATDGETWQHGYLHQLAIRWLYRLGAPPITALRLDIAILGALTALAIFLVYRRWFPERAGVGLLAAALIAIQPIHAWYSQKGWGHAGSLPFFVLYVGAGYRLFAHTGETDRKGLVRCGLLLALWSALAFGYHEMHSVSVVAMGGFALLAPALPRRPPDAAPGGYVARLLRSRRTWTFVASTVPVGAMTLALLLFNPWAQEIYFDPGRLGRTWLELRQDALRKFALDEAPRQIAWLVLAFAPLGLVTTFRRSLWWFACAGTMLLLPVAILFLQYNDPSTIRIYLPSIVLLVVFAAEGMALVWRALRAPLLKFAYGFVLALAFAHVAATSWVSLYGPLDHPFMIRGFYVTKGTRERPPFHSEEPVLEFLRRHLREGDSVGVATVKEPKFILQQAGIAAHYATFTGPPRTWPDYLFANVAEMKKPYTARFARFYGLIVKEHAERLGLFRLDRSKLRQ